MAEEAPKVANKGLLLLSVVLAAVVVIIYNLHVNSVRRSLEGKRVSMTRFTRTMKEGEKITAQDLEFVEIRKQDADLMGRVVEASEAKALHGKLLKQAVTAGQWVDWTYVVIGGGAEHISGRMPLGMVGVTIQVGSRNSPGPLCRPGDRVNILAKVRTDPAAEARVYRVITNVQVITTGTDVIADATKGTEYGRGSRFRQYRNMNVALRQEVSLQWHNLLAFIEDDIWLEVVRPDAVTDSKKDGLIAKELQHLVAPGKSLPRRKTTGGGVVPPARRPGSPGKGPAIPERG